MRTAHSLLRLVSILLDLAQDALQFLLLGTRSSAALKAENIFLRKQLALYLERKAKSRRATDATRLSMVLLSRLFAWQNALINVKPETFLGWHRKGFQLLWRWKSRPRGRPRVPRQLRELICKMAHQNQTWGEERIAAELLLKLGIRVSPRTVRRYMPTDVGPGKRVPSQRWMTFVRNHAQAIVACDFFIVVTASFRVLYAVTCTATDDECLEKGADRSFHRTYPTRQSGEVTDCSGTLGQCTPLARVASEPRGNGASASIEAEMGLGSIAW
jgi:putative transposase